MPEFQTNAGTTWERTAVVIHAVALDRFETSWEYTPVSMASAPSGWRAIYKVEKPEPGEPDWMAVPLIGWGVFHLTNHMSAEDAEWSRVVGDVIEGVVIDGMGTPACAPMAPNFLFYLGPDDPDPDSEQLNRPVRQPAAGRTTGRV